ncbi:hypothetical protein HOF56_00480 [Candidatus Peribacteria bacterium]|jgi:hypothetical protein|nr:hypothetical protein [Candidatus Peribacteria bacterium]MBT4021748.1 hypothetical protein [Candidatus Peribacteria bacterium]
MSFKDDKERKKKISSGSPDYFRQDDKGEHKEHVERIENRDTLSTKTKRELLKERIKIGKENSKPEQDKKKEIIDSQEGNDSPDDFVEKQEEREEERQSAIRHGEPRQNKNAG